MKTHIEINRANLIHNLTLFARIGGKKIIFVVKANAYGHGLTEIVDLSKHLPFIEYYAVDSLLEGLAVSRQAPKKKILVIGWADDREIGEMIDRGFEFVVPSLAYFSRVKALAGARRLRARVHLKLETGTTRLGMEPRDLLHSAEEAEAAGIDVCGVYSHFANIEDTTDHSYARQQLKVYKGVSGRLPAGSILRHFSCSASALLFPETYFDILRVGISAYGYWPSKQTYLSYIESKKKKIELKPVLSWVSRVAQVKEIERGRYIGYGLTYQTFNRSRIVIVPVGYYDGYDRRLSNISNIIVNGVKAPVRGRVCMNMIMAEVTHIPEVNEGDRVLLLGRGDGVKIDADYLADLAGTINYELLSRLNPLIPRVVVPGEDGLRRGTGTGKRG